MDCKNRIIKLRESTGLNRKDFCKLVHIPYSSACVTFTGCIFDVFKQIKIRISKAAFLPPTPKKQKYRLH